MTSKLKKMCNKILGDKMNLAERLDKQFPESSSYLYRQLGTGQVHHLNSHKTVYLTSLSGSFCHLVCSILRLSVTNLEGQKSQNVVDVI